MEERKSFNEVHKKTRSTVELAIEYWKKRCPILSEGIPNESIEEVIKTIDACAVYHQMARYCEISLTITPSYLAHMATSSEDIPEYDVDDPKELRRRVMRAIKSISTNME